MGWGAGLRLKLMEYEPVTSERLFVGWGWGIAPLFSFFANRHSTSRRGIIVIIF